MKYLLSIISLFFISQASAQFTPDWYILEKGAQYGVLRISAAEVNKNVKPEDIRYLPGQAFLVYELNNGVYTAFDHAGRIIHIKGNITRAKRTPKSGVGRIIKAADTVKGIAMALPKDMHVWIVDTTASSVKLQLSNNQVVEIPSGHVMNFTKESPQLSNRLKYKPLTILD